MSTKVSLPQGTRDFSPDTVRKRNYILNTIKNVFEIYGFQPLETPAMENLETLMGKYGEEGDKLIFRILNSGSPFDRGFLESIWKYIWDFNNEVKENQRKNGQEEGFLENVSLLEGKNYITTFAEDLKENKALGKKYLPKLKNEVTEKALRYDLTIPFARYVAMNHGQLTFPFKRYQIQPVWRADRPQKGRYREFYQCDADIVGSNALLNEIELATIYDTVFQKLRIKVEIKVNSRKILAALAELCGDSNKMGNITIAIDKLDKIGIVKVKEELLQRGLTEVQVAIIEKYLAIDGTNEEKLGQIKSLIGNIEIGKKGIEEIEYLLNYSSFNNRISADFTLARGLNYYTGIIFEVKALDVQMGSIGGGGRYDDLTGLFGVPNIPGVGISFGVDRIYDVMEEQHIFPTEVHTSTQVLFFNLGEVESKAAFNLMQQLRNKGIRCELYHENSKFDKQFKYADKKNIPYAIMIGSKELEAQNCIIRNLKEGKQEVVSISELLNYSF